MAEVITGSDSWILRIPFLRTSADHDKAHHELVGTTLRTSDAEGVGFAWVPDAGAGRTVRALLDDVLLPRLRSRSIDDVVRIWHEFDELTHRMGTGVNRFAMAAVDIALWDLRAIHSQRSLADEIGRVHDAVPGYGSGKAGVRLSSDELAHLSAGYVAQGFNAVKVRVGFEPATDAGRLAAVREAVGEDVLIMADANERFSLPEAMHWGRRLADGGAYWLEEPISSTNVDGHAQLARSLPIAIVGGEHLSSSAEFMAFARSGSLAVLQPNVSMVGGVTEIMRIARLAELQGIGFSPHALTPLHIHISAATPAATHLEYFPFLDPYLESVPEVRDGRIVVPTAPGHGVRFTKESFDRYGVA